MKRVMAVMCLVCFAFPAWGQTSEPKIKFYHFGEMAIDGQLRSPQIYYSSAKERVKHTRLLSLKKDLKPALLASGADAALR